MGLSVRRYALKLELHNYQMVQYVDEEKAFYKEESLADGYQDAVKSVQQWSRGEKDSTTFIEVAEKAS